MLSLSPRKAANLCVKKLFLAECRDVAYNRCYEMWGDFLFRESIISLIIDNYQKFTNVEKTIADYFIANKEKQDFSSKAMKGRLFVSEASLSRFAKKCGFRGYREFIYRYEEAFVEQNTPIPIGFHEILNVYHELLEQMVSYMDKESIYRLSDLINTAKYVSVIGVGSSGLVAREMKSRFMRLGIMMDVSTESDEIKMQAVLQNEETLLIAISLSGNKPEIQFSLKKAKKNGAKTVLITANKSKFSYCDEVIWVPMLSGLDAGHIISPQFPVLLILDICYYYVYHSVQSKNNRNELHKKTVEVLEEE